MKKIYLLIVTTFLTGTSILFSQNEHLVKTSIPLKIINNKYLLMKVKVNNSKDLTFYFDTGASKTLLDKKVAKALGIESDYEQIVPGAGGNLKYQTARSQKIKIAGIELDQVDLILEDLGRLNQALGYKFDGIIGYALLKDYISEINFDQKVINLYPRNSKLDLADYSVHSFELANEQLIPQMEAEIELENGEKLKGMVLFDSGAGLTLLINTPFKEKHRLVEKSKNVGSSSSNNLSKTSVSQNIRLTRLNFAGYDFLNVPVNLASDKVGVSSLKNYLGILGAEVINKFNIYLDYDTQKIYLKPNGLFKLSFDGP